MRNEMDELRNLIRQQAASSSSAGSAQPPAASPSAASVSASQLSILQQQIAALSVMTMGQHQAGYAPHDPALAALQHQANLSGYGTPHRGTPPVYPAGAGAGAIPEYKHLGNY